MGIHHEDLQELTRRESERECLLQGLKSSTPKCIPISLLYDAKGTLLYERLLDEVPSYYPYVAEDELLRLHSASIASSIPPQCRLVELGCGDATKTVHLLNGVKALHGQCKYVGIDISRTAIKMARENIVDQVKGMDDSNLTFIEDDYRQGMRQVKAMFPDECLCIMWMGGSIGNFDRDAAIDFLSEALDVVGPKCLFFLCTDLWKEEEILYKAYHDDEGITELFIKNGMRNALSLLGYEATEEEQNSWKYQVVINKELRRVEMWVIFCDDITIERYDVHLRKGEGVLVEISRKFSIRDIEELASQSNFYIQEAWRNKTYSCQMLYSAQEAFLSCWSDTDAMFDGIKDWSARPIDLRHPFLFYYGHVAAFASSRLRHLPLTNPYSDFDTMFSRGVDPNVLDPTICHDHPDLPPQWPSRESIVEYVKSVRSSILESLDNGHLSMYHVRLFLEHERMHLETLAYMLAQQTKAEFGREYHKYDNNGNGCMKPRKELVCNGSYGDDDNVLATTTAKGINDDATNVFIPSGKVVMGSEPSDVVFMWDNEMPRVERHVPDAIVVSSKPVSIRQFMAFVQDGGYEKRENWARLEDFRYFEKNGFKWPATWSKVGGEFYIHGVNTTKHWEEMGEHAVYVSLAEAEAYCKWAGGMRIMTEEEYHKALEEEDDGKRVMDLRRGGWEWTCSPFQGFQGFEPMEDYKEYSADFFDGNHFVLKGSSPVTHPSLIRDSFRNFYQRQYRYMFAKFRCCQDASAPAYDPKLCH